MIQMAAKCPNCGANHNPLMHPSFRSEFEDLSDGECSPISRAVNFTWLCDSCGETYHLDVSSDGE